MMYKAYMTGGGESSPTFKACLKMNIETRSACVSLCIRVSVSVCVCDECKYCYNEFPSLK